MSRRCARIGILGALALACTLSVASAQTFGTFSWQMQPYCNVVTLTLSSTPAGFRLDGADDQCGAVNQAGAFGLATFSGSGNVALTFTIVTAPAGRAVHVSALVSPANGQGTWTDSAGNNGTFAFMARVAGLPPRPLPASGLAPGIITTTEIAQGTVGAADINPAEVQSRVAGTCAAGQAVRAVNANGTVVCDTTAEAVRFRVHGHQLSGDLAIGQVLAVPWMSVQYNVGGGDYNPATSTYVVPVNGVYLITANVVWMPFQVSGRKYLDLLVGGPRYGWRADAATTTAPNQQQLTTVMFIFAGTPVTVSVVHETYGIGRLSYCNEGDCAFTVTKLQ